MNTNILSFNIWKLDTIWPVNRHMQTLQAQSIKTIQYRSQWNKKNQACNVFSCVKVFWKLKLTSIVDKYLHIRYPPYLKKNISIFQQFTHQENIAYTKMHRTQKLINQFFKSSWISNLAKCMHALYEKNKRYDCKNARWIKKTMQCMWILSQMMHETKLLVYG